MRLAEPTPLPTLLVIASDRRELKAVARAGSSFQTARLGLRWSARGRLAGRAALLASQGPGRDNAARATRWACDRFPIESIVCAGIAGGLDPTLNVGDVVLADSILELSSRVEYPVRLPVYVSVGGASPCGFRDPVIGKLVTADNVVQNTAEKAELRKTGARVVDMESSAVAAEGARRGLPVYCVRAVSDTAQTAFEIDFNRARREDGTFSGRRVLSQAGFSRRRWKHLLRLRREAEAALAALGEFFGRCRLSDETI